MWYIFVFTQYSYYRDLFCSGPESRLRERHYYGWVCYIDTTKITVLMFVWYRLFFTQFSYYRDFFCLGPELCLCNRHLHVWVRYIDTTKITVVCMSSLLFSIDLQQICYFIMFYFKLTNGEMEKMMDFKWCNREINNSIGHFFSHKYRFFFSFFKHNIFAADKAIYNFQYLITNNKYSSQFMLSNQATTERQDFIRGQPIVVMEILNMI